MKKKLFWSLIVLLMIVPASLILFGADTSYITKVYTKQGGDEQVIADGGKITIESGGEIDYATYSHPLSKGFLALSLHDAREISSNDYINTAGDGGVLSKDTTPILERVNAATDIATRIDWAAGNSDEIQWSFPYPPDLDDAKTVVVNILAKMSASNNTPTIAVKYFEGAAGSDVGGATGALSSTLAKVTRTITAANVGAYPKTASVTLVPGAHASDAVYIHGVWIEYTRKTK